MKKKVSIYYDFQNIYDYSFDPEEYNRQIDFIEEYCAELGKITIKNLYLKEGKYRDEDKIIESHQKLGYRIIFGPYNKDIDTLMTSDFMDDANQNNFDICVIISGDTDFVAPIKKVLERKKQVHVLCNNGTYRKSNGIAENCSIFQILPEKCRNCEGEGEIIVPCSKCDGEGEHILECKYCNGTGWNIGAYCKNCEATGWVTSMCRKCDGIGLTSIDDCAECGGIGNIEGKLCETCFGLGKIGEECRYCGGTGAYSKEECRTCEGKGFIELSNRKICSTCEGTGIYIRRDCWSCDGTGKYKKHCWRCNGTGILTFNPIKKEI